MKNNTARVSFATGIAAVALILAPMASALADDSTPAPLPGTPIVRTSDLGIVNAQGTVSSWKTGVASGAASKGAPTNIGTPNMAGHPTLTCNPLISGLDSFGEGMPFSGDKIFFGACA